MRDLLDYIVKGLVTHPEEVRIEEEQGEGALSFNLAVHPEDMGMVIGKAGQTIRAIRKLLVARALAENSNLKVFLNLAQEQ